MSDMAKITRPPSGKVSVKPQAKAGGGSTQHHGYTSKSTAKQGKTGNWSKGPRRGRPNSNKVKGNPG